MYVIDGARWTPDGRLSHVRWHSVDLPGGSVEHGETELVPVVDAAKVCDESEVRVYVEGPVGRSFKMKACHDGIEAEDVQDRTLRQLLAHLPEV